MLNILMDSVSVRAMGMGPIKPLKEQITLFEPKNRIEYQIIKKSVNQASFGYY